VTRRRSPRPPSDAPPPCRVHRRQPAVGRVERRTPATPSRRFPEPRMLRCHGRRGHGRRGHGRRGHRRRGHRHRGHRHRSHRHRGHRHRSHRHRSCRSLDFGSGSGSSPHRVLRCRRSRFQGRLPDLRRQCGVSPLLWTRD